MSDFWTVQNAFFTMIMLFLLGAILSYAVGMGHDYAYTTLQKIGVDAGAGTPWDSTREIWIITALMYFVCSLPPVFGIIIFGLSVVKRQKRSDFFEPGEIYRQEE